MALSQHALLGAFSNPLSLCWLFSLKWKLAQVVHIQQQQKVKQREKIQTKTKRAKIRFCDLTWFKCTPFSHLLLHFLTPWHTLPDTALSSLHVPLMEMSAPGLGT